MYLNDLISCIDLKHSNTYFDNYNGGENPENIIIAGNTYNDYVSKLLLL